MHRGKDFLERLRARGNYDYLQSRITNICNERLAYLRVPNIFIYRNAFKWELWDFFYLF